MGAFFWRASEHVSLPRRCSFRCDFVADRKTRVAFGHILTRLTAAKEEGAFVTTPDGNKVALGIPKAQKDAAGSNAYVDIPLRRAGTATEAASVILAVASPLFSYVNGQTIMVNLLLPSALSELLTGCDRLPEAGICDMDAGGFCT